MCQPVTDEKIWFTFAEDSDCENTVRGSLYKISSLGEKKYFIKINEPDGKVEAVINGGSCFSKVRELSDDCEYKFQDENGYYLAVRGNGENEFEIYGTKDESKLDEIIFIIRENENNRISFKPKICNDDCYLTVENGEVKVLKI